MTSEAMRPVDDAFDAHNSLFVSRLRAVRTLDELARFTDRWVRDPRPWAREQIIVYLQQPLSGIGQQAVVKRLFRHAETIADDDLMAGFLVAFDRLVRYERPKLRRSRLNGESLELPRNQTPRRTTRRFRDPRTGRIIEAPVIVPPEDRLFTYHTRYYLRRRAWRYFRQLGFRRPQDYIAAVARALVRYVDDDLARGEHILESWGLVHACFGDEPILERTATRFKLRDGHTLAELQPAPCFPDLWEAADALDVLLHLIADAHSRLVRVWGIQLVEQAHAARLSDLTAAQVHPLLAHLDAEVQQFGAKLFRGLMHLPTMPVSDWLCCLETRDAAAREVLCDAMKEHLAPMWCGMLLDVQQHGRQKRKAIEQIRDAVSVHPELADALLPVLAHAVRSSREPERRSGLSAVTTVLARHPEWHERLAALLPEVQFS